MKDSNEGLFPGGNDLKQTKRTLYLGLDAGILTNGPSTHLATEWQEVKNGGDSGRNRITRKTKD